MPAGARISARREASTGQGGVTQVDFNSYENCEASSLFPSVAGVFGLGRKITVPAVGLETRVDQLTSDQRLVVKMDIEGADWTYCGISRIRCFPESPS